jgi:hypothetical protein
MAAKTLLGPEDFRLTAMPAFLFLKDISANLVVSVVRLQRFLMHSMLARNQDV